MGRDRGREMEVEAEGRGAEGRGRRGRGAGMRGHEKEGKYCSSERVKKILFI